MNFKGLKGTLFVLFILFIILFLIFWGSSESEVKISPESTAKLAAEELVKDNLKAPSTANFTDAEVIDKKDELYMVKVTVDAQNSFGAMIRGYFLVVVKVNTSEPNRYSYSSNFAVQEVSNPPTDREIIVVKSLNNWNLS